MFTRKRNGHTSLTRDLYKVSVNNDDILYKFENTYNTVVIFTRVYSRARISCTITALVKFFPVTRTITAQLPAGTREKTRSRGQLGGIVPRLTYGMGERRGNN